MPIDDYVWTCLSVNIAAVARLILHESVSMNLEFALQFYFMLRNRIERNNVKERESAPECTLNGYRQPMQWRNHFMLCKNPKHHSGDTRFHNSDADLNEKKWKKKRKKKKCKYYKAMFTNIILVLSFAVGFSFVRATKRPNRWSTQFDFYCGWKMCSLNLI